MVVGGSHTLVALRLTLQHLNPRCEGLLQALYERMELCIDTCCGHVVIGTDLTSTLTCSAETMRMQWTQWTHLTN